MNDAPERIRLRCATVGLGTVWIQSEHGNAEAEYVRADLYEAMQNALGDLNVVVVKDAITIRELQAAIDDHADTLDQIITESPHDTVGSARIEVRELVEWVKTLRAATGKGENDG